MQFQLPGQVGGTVGANSPDLWALCFLLSAALPMTQWVLGFFLGAGGVFFFSRKHSHHSHFSSLPEEES